MKIGFVVLVRMSSSRLPGKALLNVSDDYTLVSAICYRLKTFYPDMETVVATSDQPDDDVLVNYLEENSFSVYRGSLEDVAGRFIGASEYFGITHPIRVNGDNVFIDPSYIDLCLQSSAKYSGLYKIITNVKRRQFPPGCSCEVIDLEYLKSRYQGFSDSHKEHVTKYFYDHWDDEVMFNVTYPDINFNQNQKLAVDTAEDLMRAKAYYKSEKLDSPINWQRLMDLYEF